MPSISSKELHQNLQDQKLVKIDMEHGGSGEDFFDHNNNSAAPVGNGNNNSNGNLNNDSDETTRSNLQPQDPTDPSSVDECLNLFKACCKKKTDFGLEDVFWIMFLLIIIIFSILKGLTRYTWSQITYMMFGSIGLLILLYIAATIFNKFVLEDSSTAHWNAHARYTQAAIHCRLNEEEQRVHVIAPPKMGGAKLNIIYSVGDVPFVKSASSGSSSTINGGNPSSRHGSVSSGVGMPNALMNLTTQAIQTALLGTVSSQPQPSITSTALTSTSMISTTTTATIATITTTTIKCPTSSNYPHQISGKSPIMLSKVVETSPSLLVGGGLSSLKDEIIAEEEDRPETPSINSTNGMNHLE